MVDIKIDELLDYVNEKLKIGLNVGQIEKEMKVGKDSIRKKLNKNGYKFDNNKSNYGWYKCVRCGKNFRRGKI